MSSKLQNIDISLKDLISEIENGLYTIPKFQRDFVWKSSDITSLGDSIIRGYPISSLLLMPCNGNLQIVTEPLKTWGSLINKDLSKIFYVLDGQQRLTSIARIFLNFDNDKRYYFDLLAILEEEFPEDNLMNDYRDVKLKVSEHLCRSFNKGKKSDEEPTKHNYRFISGKTIIEDKFGSVINKFLNHNLTKITEEKYDKYLNYLSALLGAISGYGIPTTLISKDADLGLICRVFEKVNSTGIKLTTFDLINAKSFDNENEAYSTGLAGYLTEQLKDFILNHNTPEMQNIFESFLGYNKENENFSDLIRIIRILFIYQLISYGKFPLVTNPQMLSKNANQWFTLWEEKKSDFFVYLKWMANEELSSVGPASYFEYIGGIVLNMPKLITINSFTKYVKKKGLSLGINSENFGNNDSEFINSTIELGKKIINCVEFERSKLIPKIDIKLNEEDVSRFNKGKVSYNIALYIMFKERFNGKFCQDIANYPIKNIGFDEHHIIPRTQSKGKGGIYDSIVNITLLNNDSNRNDVKGKKLKEYMEDIKNTIGEDNFYNCCNLNLIPYEYIDDEDRFMKERNVLITKYLNDYFK